MTLHPFQRLLSSSVLITLLAAMPAAPQNFYRSDQHVFTSQVLIEAGFENSAERHIIVNVPSDYETSNLNYPVVYMLHGSGGSAGQFGGIAALSKMVADGRVPPVIVVQPDMVPKSGIVITDTYQQYLARDVVAFADANYRTIPNRNGRAVAGWSMGGIGAVITALNHPHVFSMAGAFAMGRDRDNLPGLIKRHPQHHFPLYFFIRYGRNDNVVPSPRPFVDILESMYWPHSYVETDGDHDTVTDVSEFYPLITPGLWENVYRRDYNLRRITRTFTATAGDPDLSLDIDLRLQIPPGQTAPSLSVDLSGLGATESSVLAHDGQGRYTGQPQITPPTKHGLYLLPVRRTIEGGDPEFLFNIELQIFPADDRPLFAGAQNPSWEANRATLDPQATAQVLEGATSLKVDVSFAYSFGMNFDNPLEGFGYRLRFAFFPEEVSGQRLSLVLKGSGDNTRAVHLGLEEGDHYPLDFAQSTWQVIDIPLDEHPLNEPIHALEFNGTVSGAFYLDDIRLVAESLPADPIAVVEFPQHITPVASTESFTTVVGKTHLPLDIEVELNVSAAEETPILSLDLSSLGSTDPLSLVHRGNGRYSTRALIDQPLENGHYFLPILLSQNAQPPQFFYNYQLRVLPIEEQVLFGDAEIPNWTSQGALDLQTPEPVFVGSTSLEVEGGLSFKVEWTPPEPVKGFGYLLHFAFHPGDVETSGLARFNVNIQGEHSRLSRGQLIDDDPSTPEVDLAHRDWRVVDFPLNLPDPNDQIRAIEFNGSLKGTFYLDDIRLVPETPPLPTDTAVLEDYQVPVPADFGLDQNYPNPFNSGTIIRFTLPESQAIELSIYNIAGQRVIKLLDGLRQAGSYAINWDGRDGQYRELASGVYFYKLQAGTRLETRKLLLLR